MDEVVKYQPPKYISNWDGSFNKIKSGKSNYFRPNKEISKFKIEIKENNKLNVSKSSKGIYVILSNDFNFFYVGKTLAKLKQRLHSHIQKLTATNNNRYTTPYKWQKLAYKRYNDLKEKSVFLNDLKINFYHQNNFSSLTTRELENYLYKKYKNLLPNYTSLNDPKAI